MLVEDDQGRNTLYSNAVTHIGVAISIVYRTGRDMKLAAQLWYILTPGKDWLLAATERDGFRGGCRYRFPAGASANFRSTSC